MKIITFGTFDLLHYGHVNLLYRLSLLGELHVCVTDDVNVKNYKKITTIQDENQRNNNVSNLLFVKSSRICGRSDDERSRIIKELSIDAIYIGDDHKNNPDLIRLSKISNVKFVTMSRTEGISSTILREMIIKRNDH